MSTGHPNDGFLKRTHYRLSIAGGIYAAAIVLLCIPFFQRHLIYLHAIQWPLNAQYNSPHKYGLAPFKTINFNITTSDNIKLGAWLVLSERFYQSHISKPPTAFDNQDIDQALRDHPTVLFFHGNAANRAAPHRIASYSMLTSRLGTNVLAIDYRGFGDSSGIPSERGLGLDARAAWNWLEFKGVPADQVVVMGQSLGTGVAAKLTAELADHKIQPKGMVLIAPFSSVSKLLETYNLFGVIPLLKPLLTFRFMFPLMMKFLRHDFDTHSIISRVTSDILIVHAADDHTIPASHSSSLFSTLLDPLLPPLSFTYEEFMSQTQGGYQRYMLEQKARGDAYNELVQVSEIENFGKRSQFDREGKGSVHLLETFWGGHDSIIHSEGVVDFVGQTLGIQMGTTE